MRGGDRPRSCSIGLFRSTTPSRPCRARTASPAGVPPRPGGSREATWFWSVPDLVIWRSHYGHRATLLHYLAANGVETYRQRVPRNASSLASLLTQRGADPHATATMYGAAQTTRGL